MTKGIDITARLVELINAAAVTLDTHAPYIDQLDAALGDGDHGSNVRAGFDLLRTRRDALAAMPLDHGLETMADHLEQEIGGASGPLYAALLDGMAKAAPKDGRVGPVELADMLEKAVAEVRQVGRCVPGQKTLLDVLAPVADTVRIVVDADRTAELASRIIAAAGTGLHRTSRLVALKGKAAAYGRASLDHLDAGACALALLIGAIVGVLDTEADDDAIQG